MDDSDPKKPVVQFFRQHGHKDYQNIKQSSSDSEINFEHTTSEGAREIGTFDFQPHSSKQSIGKLISKLELQRNDQQKNNKFTEDVPSIKVSMEDTNEDVILDQPTFASQVPITERAIKNVKSLADKSQKQFEKPQQESLGNLIQLSSRLQTSLRVKENNAEKQGAYPEDSDENIQEGDLLNQNSLFENNKLLKQQHHNQLNAILNLSKSAVYKQFERSLDDNYQSMVSSQKNPKIVQFSRMKQKTKQQFFSPNKQSRVSMVPQVQAESTTVPDAFKYITTSNQPEPPPPRSTARKESSSISPPQDFETNIKNIIYPEPDYSPTQIQISQFALMRGMSPPAKLKARAQKLQDDSNIGQNSIDQGSRKVWQNNFTRIKGGSNLSQILQDSRKKQSRSPSESSIRGILIRNRNIANKITITPDNLLITPRKDKVKLEIRFIKLVINYVDIGTCIKLFHLSKPLSECGFIQKQFRYILMTVQIRSTYERRFYWAHKCYDNTPVNYDVHVIKGYSNNHLSNEIQKDISRTFPQLRLFTPGSSGSQKLSRVLHGIATYQDCGYIQGMNFIAASALVQLSMNEQLTFDFMKSLLFKYKFAQLFDFSKNGTFRLICYQLTNLTFIYLPKVHQVFVKHGIPCDLYASNWFLTMFSNDLSFDVTPNVIDLYLEEQVCGLLKMALSLLTFLQSYCDLESLSQDELLELMSSPAKRESIFSTIDQNSLFTNTKNFNISNSMLKKLSDNFQQLQQKQKQGI